jgi:hypothetical protein
LRDSFENERFLRETIAFAERRRGFDKQLVGAEPGTVSDINIAAAITRHTTAKVRGNVRLQRNRENPGVRNDRTLTTAIVRLGMVATTSNFTRRILAKSILRNAGHSGGK